MVYGEIKGSSEVHMHGILLPMVMSAVARIMDDTVCLRWGGWGGVDTVPSRQPLSLCCAASRGHLSTTQTARTVVARNAHVEVAGDGDDSLHKPAELAADMVQVHAHPEQGHDLHMMMGAALVIGFVLMLLLDQLSQHSHSHPQHGAGGELCTLSSCAVWCLACRVGWPVSGNTLHAPWSLGLRTGSCVHQSCV